MAASGTSTPAHPTETLSHLPSKFIACVRRPETAKKVKHALSAHLDSVTILQNDNVSAVEAADVILLCCKPYMVKDILAEPEADNDVNRCTIVRAMPNTASQIQESMTVISTSNPPLSDATSSLVHWIFTRIGWVVFLPSNTMDACTALCGSGPAFFALMLEATIDGAVAMGLPRAEAQKMAAQTMRGAAGLVLNGEHPALLRDKVTTPGGCTIGGLLVLEEGRVRGTVARAVREATVVSSQLGKGVQGVNGTRF
ncbi:Pyrroline-5-carboxylate reductase protein [Rutstroemia sp. NJR-2017a BVV2]|nr:Pyrroline-5-carboxylate reductase protein [Rutstroemia sp. NJR-2017a BVV2]